MKKKALKYDNNKSPHELLPPKALDGIADAFSYGAKKYSKWNWTNGFEWSRLIGSCRRHLNDFNAGIDFDDESKLCHLKLAGANIMMLIEHYERKLGIDDRHKWDDDKNVKECKRTKSPKRKK